MALRTRVWGFGRGLVIAGALVVTFFVFFAATPSASASEAMIDGAMWIGFTG